MYIVLLYCGMVASENSFHFVMDGSQVQIVSLCCGMVASAYRYNLLRNGSLWMSFLGIPVRLVD